MVNIAQCVLKLGGGLNTPAAIVGGSVEWYWNFILVIIAIRWPYDNCEYYHVRFMSQLVDIIGVK